MPKKTKAKTKFSELDREEIQKVAEYIGCTLISLPRVAKFARHNRPVNTLIDYVDSPKDPTEAFALRYLKDFLKRPWGMTTDELLEKWFEDELDFELPPESPL